MTLPRLHVVTDDAVLTTPSFMATARGLLSRFGPRIALHVRGHETVASRLLEIVRGLKPVADAAGAPLLVADRVDVALSTGAGVRLGRHSIPVAAARSLLSHRLLGYSAHAAEEARDAVADGADFVVLGTIWATASHPGRRPAGLALVDATVRGVDAPVIAIGGVTPARAAEAAAAGAHGVAVLRGVWQAEDPQRAAGAYTDALERAAGRAEVTMDAGRQQ